MAKAESEADRASFFRDEDFGVVATIRTAAGVVLYSVPGIFRNEYADAFEMAEIESSVPSFQCQSSRILVVKTGDTLELNKKVYTINKTQPDGTGITTLMLNEKT